MNIKQALDFSFGLFWYLFAISMFFCFPGVEAWTSSALHPLASLRPVAIGPRIWINILMALLVVLPGVLSPMLFILRARRYARTKLIAGCFLLAALYILAGTGEPLLYGRAALVALLSGHLLVLGFKAPASIPFNWMVYLAFILANFSFPDSGILGAVNILTGVYLGGAGLILLRQALNKPGSGDGYRVMVG